MVQRRDDTCERDEADHQMKNRYAVSLYNLSVQEKNIEEYKVEIKRCQRALKKFSSERQKQKVTSELLHYKTELEKANKEVAQIKKSIDRRARAMSSTPKTKEDAETWELIAKYAAQELATHQEELAAIQEKMEDTKKQIEAVRAASTRISEEVFDEDEIQGRGCCAGSESYLDAVSYWFAVE
mmetsp:Transcript_19266/g.28530  ORF Transcript_19266/g.28530 Transcript_19266/m.28530 type:complete len:183 (+) Transcript_19266:264-812(+)|eukprot:scaffold1300_cov120-Skeletonema_dohrnii-CCMP3373.AAC.6